MIPNPNEIIKAEQHFIWNYTVLGKQVYTATKQTLFEQELPNLSHDQKSMCDNDISI